MCIRDSLFLRFSLVVVWFSVCPNLYKSSIFVASFRFKHVVKQATSLCFDRFDDARISGRDLTSSFMSTYIREKTDIEKVKKKKKKETKSGPFHYL